MSATLTQVFYNKVAGAPAAWYRSPEGRKLLARMLRAVRNSDGQAEGRHFRNLITVACLLPRVCRHCD